MSLYKSWLRNQGLWKEEYELLDKEQLKTLTHEIQFKKDEIPYIIDRVKHILTK